MSVQEMIVTILVGVLGGGGLLELIKYLIQRRDEKKNNGRTMKDSIREIRENVAAMKAELEGGE